MCVEWTCKPNSVLPFGSEDHSSADRVATPVKRPTRKLSMETGGSTASLFGLAPQGVCLAIDARARCGALLPHHFTLTFRRKAVSFCCTFRRVATPGRYPACCPWEFGLSSAEAAIPRSTPHTEGKPVRETADFIPRGKRSFRLRDAGGDCPRDAGATGPPASRRQSPPASRGRVHSKISALPRGNIST
jgi:hypothetical protein